MEAKFMVESGRQIGRYRIQSAIGEGGMGAVYLAADTVLLRNVALKVLPGNIAGDKERLSRFEREAHAVSALNHPNILTVYEFGSEAGVHYLATEFVDGRTLRDELQTGGMSTAVVLSIAEQTALAISAAHAAGIVHRDIKPENIMVRRDGIVKVLDFGLAKLARAGGQPSEAEAATKLQTNPGVVMGTVAYMSPEQAKGKPVDERTDIWSLGVVLYEMVCGTTPFDGESANEVIAAILQNEPRPISMCVSNVPRDLERLIGKCLRKDPEQRYQHIKDVLIDVRDLKEELGVEAKLKRSGQSGAETKTEIIENNSATGGTISAPTDEIARTTHQASSAEYVVSEIKSHKQAALVSLSILLLAAIGFVYWLSASRTSVTPQIESIAVMPFVNDGSNADTDYLSDGITESVINNLTKLPNLRVISRNSVFKYKGKETDPEKVGQELNVRSVLTGRIVQRGDNLIISAELTDLLENKQIWGQQYNRKTMDAFALQREISRDISETLRSKLTGEQQRQLEKRETDSPEAYQLYLKGRYHWNKREDQEFVKALAYFQQAIDQDPAYALAYVGLAETHLLGNYGNPQRWEKVFKAKAAAQKALEIDATLGEAHNTLANIKHWDDWNWEEAEKEYKRAIELSPNYATAHHWYAESLSAVGRFDESFAEYNRALDLDPLSLAISTDLGLAYFYSRQYDRAIAHFKKLIELDPKYVRTHFYLAEVYEEKGMFEEAIAEIEKGTILRRGNTQEFAESRAVIQNALKKSGAKGYWQQVLEIKKQEEKKGDLLGSINVAGSYAKLGEADEAFKWLEKAYAERNAELVWLRIAPKWDNIRSDPRFADLQRRIGLPQ